jgi:hypothetical protein
MPQRHLSPVAHGAGRESNNQRQLVDAAGKADRRLKSIVFASFQSHVILIHAITIVVNLIFIIDGEKTLCQYQRRHEP